jgi:threonyl-tRNA synthetase
MLHRAIFGSLERFMAILIEHHAGNLPLWLAPMQVKVLTITSDADDYATEIETALRAAGVRAETDLRNEKLAYKVREHSVAKVPVQFAVGERELENRSVAIRRLGSRKQEVMSLDDAIAALKSEIENRGSSD